MQRYPTTKQRWKRQHGGARAVVLAAALLVNFVCASAHADLYGYVDGNGAAHMANRPLDKRYKLFVRSGGSLDLGGSLPGLEAVPADRQRLFDALARHPALARYEPLITQAARKYALDPALLKALIAIESGFDPSAVSPKGAIGLMQIIPGTGARYGVAGDVKRSAAQKLAEPSINIATGAHYLRDLIHQYPNRIDLVLAAYNAGEGAVIQHGNQVPPYAETKMYVQSVLEMVGRFNPDGQTTLASHYGTRFRRIHVVLPVAPSIRPLPPTLDVAPSPGGADDDMR